MLSSSGASPADTPPRFKILRRIGEGGMGMVYEAEDLEREVRVALKTVLQHDPDALARFKHEFRALQDIHHPNLVSLGELVAEGDEVFFTMELVEGVDLVSYVCGGRRSNEADDVEDRRGGATDCRADDRRAALGDRGRTEPRTAGGRPQRAFRTRNSTRRAFATPSARSPSDSRRCMMRRNPPRRQAVECPRDAGRARRAPRLRARHGDERSDRTVHGRDAGVHGAGAGDLGRRRTGDGLVRDGRHDVPVPHRTSPVRGVDDRRPQAKLERDPMPPSALVQRRASRPRCSLRSAPERSQGRTPRAHEVLRRLDSRAPPPVADGINLAQSGSTPFVGRARELVEIARAFTDVVSGRAVPSLCRGSQGSERAAW